MRRPLSIERCQNRPSDAPRCSGVAVRPQTVPILKHRTLVQSFPQATRRKVASVERRFTKCSLCTHPALPRRQFRHVEWLTDDLERRVKELSAGLGYLFWSFLTELTERDLEFLRKAATISRTSEGLYQPHPYSGCVLVRRDGRILAETHHEAQGTATAESQALERVDPRDATVYLNMEPGDTEGGASPTVQALIQSGVRRVVLGMIHPLPHLRNRAVKALVANGVEVAVLGIDACQASDAQREATVRACLEANVELLHRVVTGKPFSVLKYAMTLDGKIAASSGHSAWVSCPMARQRVFATRALSNAVIVGGNTVRRDNPNLTTRRESGFSPTRIVMSRTMDLQPDANLWNVDIAPTIVMTQRGARSQFQQELRDRGVDVVEFDFLSPSRVADYCYQSGFLQLLWECGGALSAPAISDGVIHKIMAFVSPKIIGGVDAPTPCGDLGFVEMTQAVAVSDMKLEQVGPDAMLTGYLPSSGGLDRLNAALTQTPSEPTNITSYAPVAKTEISQLPGPIIAFYKSWDAWGCLSNFGIYPIQMLNGAGPHGRLASDSDLDVTLWPSVEHYYQAQKFAGLADPRAEQIRQAILESSSSEEAAKIGRHAQRTYPSLQRPDWLEARVEIMHEAVLAKFQSHDRPRALLLSTGDCGIVESSPRDAFWGCGVDGDGANHLGKVLMSVRSILHSRASHPTPSHTDSVI